MSEPVMLWIAVPAGTVLMMAIDWVIGHPRCKRCRARCVIVREEGQAVVAKCPLGCTDRA